VEPADLDGWEKATMAHDTRKAMAALGHEPYAANRALSGNYYPLGGPRHSAFLLGRMEDDCDEKCSKPQNFAHMVRV